MNLKDFFSRWFEHVASAAALWLVCILLLEVLIPGSVTPFVDLVDVAGVVGATCIAALLCSTGEISPIRPIGRIGLISRCLLTLSAGAIGAFFLWSRFSGSNEWEIALTLAFGVVAVLAILALFVQKPASATMPPL